MEFNQVMTALRNADAAGDKDAAHRLAQIAKGMMGEMGGMDEMPTMQPIQPAEGIGAALKGGFKRYGSSLETALESIIDPQKAAERGLERGRDISKQYAPGASLERVKQKYEQEGLFPAAREAIGQIPAALVEQTPNMAAALGGARLGAMAGAPIGGPVGALIGGGIGAAAAALPQLYASNLERQAEEGKQVERSSALGAAIPGAAAEVASQFIPLGRGLVGKILGPTAEKALAKGTDEAIERAAKESLMGSVARGAGVGLLAEIPTEVSQQMLERLQAGLPLTTPDALAEYGEAAYGAGLVGAPFGVAGRTMGRPAARAEFEARQQEKMMTETPPVEEAPTNITQMPGGYAVQREEIMGGMRPKTFNITMPGAETPLASVDTEEEAQKKLESFTQIRQQERESSLNEIEKINEGVQKMQSKLDYMEATGQANTEEYTQLKANLPAYMENAAQKSAELHDKIEMYGKPLEIVPVGEKQQVQEAYKVLDKAGQTVNTFPTLGEAEAHVKEIVGEKPFKQAQQQADTIKALEEQLVPAMQKFGLKDVGLKVVANIENNAGGAYFNKLMRVAMDEANPLQTMRHESVHALKDLGFFTPQQWKALEERAKKEWIKTHLEGQQTEIDGQPMTRLEGYRKLGLSEDAIIEEAIADAFAAYDKGQTPPPGLIAQLFKRLKQFFANLGQAMRGAGFESADDIFQRIERGDLKPSLKGAESAKTGEIKYSQAPEGVPQKIWDLHQKSMAADEAASGYNVGSAKANATKATRRLLKAVADHVGDDDQKQIALMVKMNEESNRRGEGYYGTTRFSLKKPTTVQEAIDDGVKRLVESARKHRLNTLEERYMVGLARADTALTKIQDGIEKRLKDLGVASQPEVDDIIQNKVLPAVRSELKKTARYSLPKPNEWKATKADIKQAQTYEEENGILPYTSEGQLDVPLDVSGTKYSIKKPYDQKAIAKDQTLKNDPLTGLPMNANGTVTLYFPTDNTGARDLARTKMLKPSSAEANRIYLTNQSDAAAIQAKPGMIDQPLGGANVLLQVDPSLIHLLEEHADGRKDFFIPIAEGESFAKRMKQTKLFTMNAPRTKGLHPDRTLAQVTKSVNDTADAWAKASKKDRAEMAKKAKATLRDEHNIEKLFGANAKLEKTNIGDYGLTYNGKKVMSTGLGFASAQKINDEQRATTCPQSGICEDLCLGETSGQNLLYGGDGQFRSGPRLSQFLKTEALVVNPEAFAVALIKQIDTFRNAAKKLGYQPAIRLNVTSDFNPKTFENIIKMFPDVVFYDYTKLDTKPIAPNHHLTYSSTGASQVVNGQPINNKFTNWDRMVDKVLPSGRNVAMAFSDRNNMPKFVKDERTGKVFEVWNGDEYDARFLDPVRPDGDGWIIGLTNKDRTTAPEDAAAKHNGFFLDYNKERDGDTLVIPDQSSFKKTEEKPVAFVAKPSYSLKTSFPTADAAEAAAYQKAPPATPEFKQWFGASKIMDEGRPQVMYHASPEDFDVFRENKPIFVSPSAKEAEYFGKRHRTVDNMKVNVMPLWVRAETPFDYENRDHVTLVRQELIDNPLIGEDFATSEERLMSGDWSAIEDESVLEAIRKLGFDSFYVSEGKEKNLAVFNANQVKSVTGNTGDFSIETKDMRFSLKKVRYSDERFDKLWNQSMYTQSNAENKTKGYLAFVNPIEFVNATATPETFERLRKEQEPLDFKKMRTYDQVPYLSVSEKNGDWKITGHEGRHRMLALHNAGYREVPVYIQMRAEDAKAIPVKKLSAEYDDSISSILMVVDVEPLSFANKNKALEKFTRMDSKVKYSLPNISQGATDAINRVTTTRESKGFMERILGALSPENYTYYRQQALNRYEALSVADKIRAQKIGNVALMADQSAETAALMSDLHSGVAASVFGIQGRRGGVPVFRNGITTVDHTKKGLVEVLSPLAKYGDPKVYQYFQFYSAVKRGARLFAEGRERLITPADQQHANELAQKFPEFEAVRKDWVAFNDAVTDYLKQTGVLSAADAARFKQYADYIPFYRQLDGENTMGPNIFQSLSGVKKPKTLKGGEAPLADFMETIVRNTHAAITAGMKNTAEQRVIKVGKDIGIITDIQPGTTVPEINKVKVLIDGVKHEYQCSDQMFAEATRSLNMTELPFMSFLSAPANLLRNLITREPGFIMTNLLRDSMSAYVTSGANITPIAGTAINFAKAMKGNSPAFEALMDAGIIGGYEFSANIEQSGERLTADLMKKSGKGPTVLKPFTAVWDGLEKATTASDAATRMAVYERVLAETGNEAEALSRALEVMNFNRKGSSAVVRILTAAVPFLNARMQGLDLFYRSMTGKMNNTDAKEIQAKFFTRGMMLLGMSTMYYFAMAGDPEYEKQEQETKDNNWLIPSLGIRIPIPFEVGILFKTIPERIAAYTFGNDTGKDFLDAMKRAGNGFIPVSPSAYIPQTFKPIIEAMTNYSFFTQREIVGMGLKDVAPEYQVGPGTSAFAEFVGKTLGLSPLKVDHVFKGYTGTMGMYAVDLMDVVMDLNSDSPKPTKRFEQLPIIKRFVADPEARGNVTNYYQLKDSVDTAVRTMNLLEKSGDPKEFAAYVKDNAGLLAFRSYVNDLEKTMKDLRDMKRQVLNSPMSGDEKRDTIKAIGQAENNLTVNIQTVKKVIEGVKP